MKTRTHTVLQIHSRAVSKCADTVHQQLFTYVQFPTEDQDIDKTAR